MHKPRVAVLRGGPSPEYDVSLETGSAVLSALPDDFEGFDVFIDKKGAIHRGGVEMNLAQALRHADAVFNALHGEYGEDGTLARDIEGLGVPYTGARPLGLALALRKDLGKEALRAAGIRVPRSVSLGVSDVIGEQIVSALASFTLPVVIKPASAGSSLGVTLARSVDEAVLAIRRAFLYATRVLVEEYIDGVEVTAGIVDGLRGERWYSLVPVEVVPPQRALYDWDAKRKNKSVFFAPPRLSRGEEDRIRSAAAAAHKALGLRHYSRSDFILAPDGRLYLLEVNALPGLGAGSPFAHALERGGIGLGDFLKHVLGLALERN